MINKPFQPLISVVVPIYNRSHSLERAVNSVVAQSYQFFELILIDDCSTDGSWETMNSFDDKRISCIKMKKNSGASAARNFGINYSKSKYVSFLDSDDYYEPNFLQETIDMMEKSNENIGLMWTGVRYFENGTNKDFLWSPKLQDTPYLTFLNSLHIGTNSGITVKREVFEKCGAFDENLPAAEDTEFFLRVTKHYDFIHSKQILVNIEKDGKDRLSKNFVKIAKAYNQFIEDHLDTIDLNKFLKNKFYYKMMWLNYHASDKKLARYYFKNIPVIEYLRHLKILAVMVIYELFPLQIATKIHFKFSFKGE